jgi:cysteine-rich repeat protein
VRVLCAVLVLAACGDDSAMLADAMRPDAAAPDATCDGCCGNGVVEGTEACDDGNLNDFDGCSHDCRFEGALVLQSIQEQPGTIGCDFNGDGVPDNELGAALNQAARDLLSSYVTNSLLKNCVVGSMWVLVGNDKEMLTAPFDLTVLSGLNADGTGGSNFSGSARFQIMGDNLDAFGHPILMLQGNAPLNAFATNLGIVKPWLPYCTEPGRRVPLEFDHAQLTGTLTSDANGPSMLMVRMCAARTARSWYNVRNDTGLPGNTMLDLLVLGLNFSAYHITPSQPDFDADRDGLERFLDTDGDGNVDTCIDGNGTQISGVTCPADPRIADGYTEALDLQLVSAKMAGRAP